MNFYRLLLMITFLSFFKENAGWKDRASNVKDWGIEKAGLIKKAVFTPVFNFASRKWQGVRGSRVGKLAESAWNATKIKTQSGLNSVKDKIPNFIKNNRKVQGIIAIILAGMAAEATYSIDQDRKHKKKFEENVDLFLKLIDEELQSKINKIIKKEIAGSSMEEERAEVVEESSVLVQGEQPIQVKEAESMKEKVKKMLGDLKADKEELKYIKDFFEKKYLLKRNLMLLANSKDKSDFQSKISRIEKVLIEKQALLDNKYDNNEILRLFKNAFENQLQEKRSFFVDAFQSIKTKINEKLGR